MAWKSRDVAALRRWILPFSRQFTVTAMSYTPLIPWRWKMAAVKHYLRHHFYSRAGLPHVAPPETEVGMDYTGETKMIWALSSDQRCLLTISAGQCNDAIFRLGRSGVLSVLVDSVAAFARDGVFLRSGRFLGADMVVMAAGCKQIAQPPFLHKMGLGAACHRSC